MPFTLHHLQNHLDDSSSVALMSWPGLSDGQPPSKNPQRTKIISITKEIPRDLGAWSQALHHSGNYNSLRSSVSGTRAETDIYINVTPYLFTLVWPIQKRTGLHYLWSSEYTCPAQSYLFAHLNCSPVVLYFPNHALVFCQDGIWNSLLISVYFIYICVF